MSAAFWFSGFFFCSRHVISQFLLWLENLKTFSMKQTWTNKRGFPRFQWSSLGTFDRNNMLVVPLKICKLVLINTSRVVCYKNWETNWTLILAIVSRGDWLWNPANFKGPSLCYDFRVVTSPLLTMFWQTCDLRGVLGYFYQSNWPRALFTWFVRQLAWTCSSFVYLRRLQQLLNVRCLFGSTSPLY